jgi:hypothetical protein
MSLFGLVFGKNPIITTAFTTSVTSALSLLSNLTGHRLYHINFYELTPFGIVAGAISKLALNLLGKVSQLDNFEKSKVAISVSIGGLTAFGTDKVFCALGLFTNPISASTALVLTAALTVSCLAANYVADRILLHN